GQGTLGVLGGSVVAELGMVACTPLLVGLFGRLGRRLPLSPRLALRDAVRHRGRTAPAVAAVMAAVAGSVAVGIYNTSNDQQLRDAYRASLPSGAVMLSFDTRQARSAALATQERSAVEQAVPGLGTRGDVFQVGYGKPCAAGSSSCGYVQVVLPEERRCPATDGDPAVQTDPGEFARLMGSDPRCREHHFSLGGAFGDFPAGDGAVLRNLFGIRDQQTEQALAQGKAVVFDPAYVKDGRVAVRVTEPSGDENGGLPRVGADGRMTAPAKSVTHEILVEAVVATSATPNATALISPQAAERNGLTVTPTGSVWLPDGMPSGSAEQRAAGAAATVEADAKVTVERGYRSDRDAMTLALTGFAALVALGAAGIATGLAAADSQHDLATLAAVGADGGVRRRLSGFQCGVIAAMGVVLGTVTGAVPALAIRLVQGHADPKAGTVIVVPWLDLGLMLVVLPAVATLLAMLFSRSRLGVLRRAA
ncbi:ABC transporter permease, partial [Kitasatospora sp. NPDC056138]